MVDIERAAAVINGTVVASGETFGLTCPYPRNAANGCIDADEHGR
ncbi:vancomycin resistance protein YoaR [Mycolicibacterium iranicum]|uniref:Vancomycin resistance protein YoaR n=1 Tax=Mycolicibacterium iranicum TaxID=912594 RepID=A0A839Q8X5_MYCIR|nr:VanW family protein [Mycolicibacterium iranicum]MBB2989672.1 vancomycin resistance protein YoaR [Mycolicibacterium iranicum]